MTAQYVYNGLGQRVIKEAGGQVTYFHYELDGKLIAETPAGGSTVEGTEHIYRGKGLLARVDASSGAVYHYHTNYLGAVHQITDAAGMIVWEAVYMPFGRATVNAGSTVESSWRMPGQYYDSETGLHYNYFRYYDPETGRYLTPDPIGLAGGINPYAYVANNPVGAIDPMGLETLTMGPGLPIYLPPNEAQIEANRQLARGLEQFIDSWFSTQNLQNLTKFGLAISDPGMAVNLMGKGQGDKYGPLWNAPGMPGWENPQNNEPHDPDWWKKPNNWDKMSKWEKFKWWLKKAAGACAGAGGIGV